MPKKYRVKASGDFILIITVLGLTIFGVIMVFSASFYDTLSEIGNPYYYLLRSSIWALCGVAAMILVSLIPYKFFYNFALPIMIISIALLGLLFTPLGETRNYATRWLEIGPITIMPGEIAKLAAIIFVAWYLSRFPKAASSFLKGVLPMLLLMGALFALIYKQPSLSTAITICGIIAVMIFVAGMKVSHMFILAGAGIGGIVALILSDPDGYHLQRITTFMNPFEDQMGDGYQVVQSLLALGAGGVTGVGLGKSIQKALYLPEAQNDFIFAIIGEETGYIGCLLLISAYIILIWRGTLIALKAPDRFSMLIAAGVVAMVALQVLMNIAVVTSSIPPTGVTLPFVSYGGNAMILYMSAMGLLLNISRRTAKLDKEKEIRETEKEIKETEQ